MRAVLSILLLLVSSCRQETPPAGEPAPGQDGGRATVYSYVDDRGRIRMAEKIEDIPEDFRGQVALTDTGRPRSERLSPGRVLVVDLRQEGHGGPLNYTVVDLESLGRAEPLQARPKDPGELGRQAVLRAADRTRRLLGLGAPRPAAAVILYSAPWCGFCEKAARHLRERGVAFEQRDVDADRSAAVELSRKLRQAGLSGGGVPVLDIAGAIVVGFKKEEIDRLLEGR